MRNYEVHKHQLERLKNLISTTPNTGKEDLWVKEFNTLITEIKDTLSTHIKHRLNHIDLNCYIEEAPFIDSYLFSGLGTKSEKMLVALLEDEIFYYATEGQPNEVYLRKKKLLEARRESVDFEEDLATIICGDNPRFPYRSSYYITKFFQDNGYNYTHDGTTRVRWVATILQGLNIHDIYILTEAVFKRKYLSDFAKTRELDLEQFISDAQEEFSNFLENSISANKVINLSSAYKLNVNIELLSNKIARTDDNIFNELIDSAKNFYIEGEKQEAIEKVWDAFERLKSIKWPSNKKKSVTDLIEVLSTELKEPFFESEFKTLTEVGNNYMIRHSEVNKIPLTDIPSKDYLFFRVLALIDLAIQKMAKN